MIFLDTNILLEIVLPNRKHLKKVEGLLESLEGETAISPLTIHLIMHFGRKAKIRDSYLHEVIASNMVLNLESEDYLWAASNEAGKDFEDALQVAVAIRSECQKFVTLDRKLLKRYSEVDIELVSP